MSPVKYEALDGGLVTSTDPAKLQPGELQQAFNAFYFPFTDSICTPPALSDWNTVASGQDVTGLITARFDNGNHFLVAQASGKYWTASAETDASAFTSATSVTAGNQLVAVEFDNRYYVLNGSGENLVMLQDGTFRRHGLFPVSSEPQFIGTTASSFSGSATGFYDYWYTEVVRFSDNSELESTFTGTPKTISVTSTAIAPIIELATSPSNIGQGTNISYRIYRSEAHALEVDKLYPVGTKMGDVPTVDNAGVPIKPIRFTDTGTTSNIGNKVAASNDTVLVKSAVTSTLVGGAASVSDAVSVTGDGKLWRVSATAAGGGGPTGVPFSQPGAAVQLYNYSPGTITGNIVGIEVVVRAAGNTANIADVWVSVGKRDTTLGLVGFPASAQFPGGLPTAFFTPSGIISPASSRIAKHQTVSQTVLGAGADMTFGSSSDNWIPPNYGWPLSQFTSDFGIQLGVVFGPGASNGDRIDIDFVRINIYYVGTSSATTRGKLYDAISIEQGGATLHYGANGKPPVASTGAVYEGSLVTDDVANPGKLVWSVATFPDYFPTDVYFNVLETGDNDTITFLGVVNDKLVAGTKGSLWRVNYLPNELDASFSRGRALSLISDRVGILRPTAACLFTAGDGTQELAFVDANGVYATNGYTVRNLSDDLRWVGFGTGVFTSISSSIYSQVVGLINDPTTQSLRLMVGNGYLSASYAPRHIKRNGGLKWAGPTNVKSGSAQPSSACVFRRNTGVWIVVFGYKASAGSVRREDSNDSSAYNTFPNAMVLLTRDIYPNDTDGEVSFDGLIVEGTDLGLSVLDVAPSWRADITQLFENVASPAATVLTYTSAGSGAIPATKIPCGTINCNGVRIQLAPTSGSNGRLELQQLGLELTDFGSAELAHA